MKTSMAMKKIKMNKVIVLHDNKNGKRRVVEAFPAPNEYTFADSCGLCCINVGRIGHCELEGRSIEFENMLFSELENCGFRDIFEPEA